MISNQAKSRLRAGLPSIGTWLTVPSPYLAEQVAGVGFDWLVADAEHNPMSIETLAAMFTAIKAAGDDCAPMVRIPWNTPENIKRVLDAGAWGIVVPMVNSRAEAEQVVEAAKYPPEGKRSVGGGRHKISLRAGADPDYTRLANEQILVVVQMEHISAVERADEILSVPGIDACYIGPNDLLASMGHRPAGHSDHPDFTGAVEHVLRTAKAHGVAPGMHVYSVESINRRIREGFQMLALSSEAAVMLASLRASLGQIDWDRRPM